MQSTLWISRGVISRLKELLSLDKVAGTSAAALDPPGIDCSFWSVAVVVRLVGAVDRQAEVGGLLGPEGGELHPERVEMKPGHLLVEQLREDIDALFVF